MIFRLRTAVCLILLVGALAACWRQDDPNGASVASNDATPAPTATATPTPTPTATPTATPEPLIPAVTVTDQVLDEDGLLTIAEVIAAEPGWLAVYSLDNGEAETVLGYAAVSEGANQDVIVTVNPLEAPASMVAALHVDRGRTDVFEFPGPDEPVVLEGATVATPFAVDIRALVPTIMVSDQDIAADGLVRIDGAASAGPGWLAIQADANGSPGPLLAHVPLEHGRHENLALTIDWLQATPRLYAALYHDRETPGRFEPEVDAAVVVRNSPVVTYFDVTLPPDVLVLDQPVVDGKVEIERVISNGPGWIVIYSDREGVANLIIGQAFLEDGLNERVVVSVIRSAVTTVLHAVIHEDTEVIGEFEFPRADQPIRYEGRTPNPFSFRTNQGNYLIARDQPLGEDNAVVVPLVVVNINAWVAIQKDVAGRPADVIGYTWIPAGINREVVVTLDPEQITETLYAVLHQDAGTPQQFDFPNGVDLQMQRNRNIIRAPFYLRP